MDEIVLQNIVEGVQVSDDQRRVGIQGCDTGVRPIEGDSDNHNIVLEGRKVIAVLGFLIIEEIFQARNHGPITHGLVRGRKVFEPCPVIDNEPTVIINGNVQLRAVRLRYGYFTSKLDHHFIRIGPPVLQKNLQIEGRKEIARNIHHQRHGAPDSATSTCFIGKPEETDGAQLGNGDIRRFKRSYLRNISHNIFKGACRQHVINLEGACGIHFLLALGGCNHVGEQGRPLNQGIVIGGERGGLCIAGGRW